MNREQYYKLRHHIRASGFSWNWGERVTIKRALRQNGEDSRVGKTRDLHLVLRTILHPHYDKFEKLRPLHVLIKHKRIGEKDGDNRAVRSKVIWQNWMRSNVRHDNRVFSEQLTSY